MGNYDVSQWIEACGAILAITGTWTAIVYITLNRRVENIYVSLLARITFNAFRNGVEVHWDDLCKWYKAEVPIGELAPREAREALAQAERFIVKDSADEMRWGKAVVMARNSIPEGEMETGEAYGCMIAILFWQIGSMLGLRSCTESSSPSAVGITLSMIGTVVTSIISIVICFLSLRTGLRGWIRLKRLSRAAN